MTEIRKAHRRDHRDSLELAGENITVLNVVRRSGTEIFKADSSIISHASNLMGLATETITSGNFGRVFWEGEYTDGTWSWTPDGRIYLNGNGVLSQTPPSLGFIVVIGFAVTATTILVQPETFSVNTKTTAITETLVINSSSTVIEQTASGITTSLSGFSAGNFVTIHNKSTDKNTINLIINGDPTPTIRKKETFDLFYTGTNWILK